MFSKIILILILVCLVAGCNSDLTKEEKKELWSKAQTTGEIINRSGTTFNSGTNKGLALSDAKTRLQTGGGLFGKDGGLTLGGEKDNQAQFQSIGMPINAYLWRASLETINFIPLSSANALGGTIITDWYTTPSNQDERCKINIFIKGPELKTQNLQVTSFCQKFENQKWVNIETNFEQNNQLENVILNKAKKIKLQLG